MQSRNSRDAKVFCLKNLLRSAAPLTSRRILAYSAAPSFPLRGYGRISSRGAHSLFTKRRMCQNWRNRRDDPPRSSEKTNNDGLDNDGLEGGRPRWVVPTLATKRGCANFDTPSCCRDMALAALRLKSFRSTFRLLSQCYSYLVDNQSLAKLRRAYSASGAASGAASAVVAASGAVSAVASAATRLLPRLRRVFLAVLGVFAMLSSKSTSSMKAMGAASP